MSALDALRDGRLADALTLQEAAVRDRPDDPAARLFLVELLTLAGRHHDAWTELSQVDSDDPGWPAARRGFRRLIRCGRRRERAAKPAFVPARPVHAGYRWRAWRALRWNDVEAAVGLIDRADAAALPLRGHVDGREFDGLRDADDRFASVLEVVAGRDYAWVPWEHVRRLTLRPEKHALDRAFRPARLRLADGAELNVDVPLVYPGSHEYGDVFAVGLETDRVSPDGGPVRCAGAKLLFAGDEELPLGECRQLDVRVWA
jgi:type VI secretion system protein ImpE